MSSPDHETLTFRADPRRWQGRLTPELPRRRRRFRWLTAVAGSALVCVTTMVGPSTAGATTVRVQGGQNLTQIARTYGTTVSALVAANGIPNPNLVVEGTVLTVPTVTSSGATPAAAPPVAAPPVAAPPAGASYAVAAPGDSLWSIATRNGTTVGALAQANGIPVTATILVGRRLVLPAHATGTSSSAPSTGLPVALQASPSRLALIPLFQRWAARFGVPVALVEGTCWWESGWQNGVVSSTGAVGIGQLEPSTVVTFQSILGDPTLSAYDPSDNIEMTAAYLHQLLVLTGGSESQTLAAYYQGLASLTTMGELPSTAQYVQGVLATTTLFG